MKTQKDIQALIDAEREGLSKNLRLLSSKQVTTIHNKIEFYEYLLKYLQTGPSKEFCEMEHKRLLAQKDQIEARFPYWKANICPKNIDPKTYKQVFNKDTGLTKIKKQIKTLEFLLSDNSATKRSLVK